MPKPPGCSYRGIEGDLINGKGSRSAIGTLVERTLRFIMQVHLAGNLVAENLRDRLMEAMRTLPAIHAGLSSGTTAEKWFATGTLPSAL